MVSKRKVLWVSDEGAPWNVAAALRGRWELTPHCGDQPLETQLAAARLALLYPNGASNDPRRLGSLLGALEHTSAVAVLVLPRGAESAWRTAAGRKGQFICVPDDASPDELAAHLAAAAALQPTIADLHDEIDSARKLASSADGSLEELDEEMRLAARLQRDFLPRRLPEVGPLRFGVMYRPATWLSGDIYDIVRLDECHVGFYVADAVGHGMPAALLTMFIKHALQTKRIAGHTYQIIPPEVSLGELNTDICEQNLSSCQFCTAFYGVLDTRELSLTYCRAGHPPPVLLHADGRYDMLEAPGTLLGVFPEERFESRTVRLAEDDRLVIYSDGAESALCHAAHRPNAPLGEILAPLAGTPRDEMLLQTTALVETASPNPDGEDDITIVLADVESQADE